MASPTSSTPILLLPLIVFLISDAPPSVAAARHFSLFTSATAAAKSITSSSSSYFPTTATRQNPFTAKAATLRYWKLKLPNSPSRPQFLLSKLSPLSSQEETTFSSLISGDPSAFSANLPAFCSAANLLCAAAINSSEYSSRHESSNFSNYQNANYTNYGTAAAGGVDSFKNYSGEVNIPVDTFRRYSRDSSGHEDTFSSYSGDANVATDNFTSYGGGATGGEGTFVSYEENTNGPDLSFSTYEDESNGRKRSFSSYTGDSNSGEETFSNYGKHGNGIPATFSSYGNDSNVITSNFANYGESTNSGTDTFAHYGDDGNVPETGFRSYGAGGNSGKETFISYRDQSNVGDDTFQSYGKNSNDPNLTFSNYGNSFNEGSDRFKSYAENSNEPKVNFNAYAGDLTDFKGYNPKGGAAFSDYKNSSVVPRISGVGADPGKISDEFAAALKKTKEGNGGKSSNRWVVEPGKFFRERSLKEGTIMAMPDIRDKMPARSFLPRSISSKLPLMAEEVSKVFQATPAMRKTIGETVRECERAPSKGETKQCAVSAEDVIDFASAVIGSAAVARATQSAAGSGGDVRIGKVTTVDGGNVTKAVSCHQSLFPYLLYYCHSVPKVRVYDAEILAVHSDEKINRGVAICHLDTSDWSPRHGAFVSLGPAPGKIEVCHWIFQGDMTWTVSD